MAFTTYREYGTKRYDVRKEQGASRRDLFHFIVSILYLSAYQISFYVSSLSKTNEEGVENMDVSREQGLNDIFSAMVAGADTTSTVLGGLFFYILSNPAVYTTLQQEVDSEFPLGGGEPFDSVRLAAMPYLNAVM